MPHRAEDHLRQYQLCADGEQAALEARNGYIQAARVKVLVEAAAHDGHFALTPDCICELHRLALDGIYSFAGEFRDQAVFIQRAGTVSHDKHQPPTHLAVAGLVDDLCNYINGNFGRTAVHLSAYVMWRLNWIHPFLEGNGRTSRAVSYLVLCARLGFWLPGAKTIPEQIVESEERRNRYYRALEAADAATEGGLAEVESLVDDYLAVQLLSVHRLATGSP